MNKRKKNKKSPSSTWIKLCPIIFIAGIFALEACAAKDNKPANVTIKAGQSCSTSECHPKMGKGAYVHGPVATGDCSFCHKQENKDKHRFQPIKDVEALCYECHEKLDMGSVVHQPVADGDCTVSMGRTTALFRWSVIFGLATLVGYAAGLPWGIFGVACSASLTQLILVYFYFAVPFRMIGLPVSRLVAVLRPFLLASGAMGVLVGLARVGLTASGLGPKLVFLICVGLGLFVYAALIWRLRPPALDDLVQLLGVRFRRGRLKTS